MDAATISGMDVTGTADEARRLEGASDLMMLTALAFSFPTEELARALSDESFASDVSGCLCDVGASGRVATDAAKALRGFAGEDPSRLLNRLKVDYSLLYLAPGSDVPVWPYEAPFEFVRAGREGAPSLFRSPVTLDVERIMRDSGVISQDARTEPVDSVWHELAYLSYALARVAQARRSAGDSATEGARWFASARDIWSRHVGAWVPDFLSLTIERAQTHARTQGYPCLARMGTLSLEAVSAVLG